MPTELPGHAAKDWIGHWARRSGTACTHGLLWPTDAVPAVRPVQDPGVTSLVHAQPGLLRPDPGQPDVAPELRTRRIEPAAAIRVRL